MHRIGGLEKEDVTGAVSYDTANHEHMVELRARKVAGIANDVPPQQVEGPESGRLLDPGLGRDVWGPGHGRSPALGARRAGGPRPLAVPQSLPAQLGTNPAKLRSGRGARAESGPALRLVRAEYLIDAVGLNQTTGRPFSVSEVMEGVEGLLRGSDD